MSLKRQFALFVLGLLLIPVLVATIIFTIFKSLETTERKIFEFRNDKFTVTEWLASDQLNTPPKLNSNSIVVLENDTILYQGSAFESNTDVQEFINRYDVLNTWLTINDVEYQVIYVFKKGAFDFGDRLPMLALFVPISVLTFITLMAVWILRSFHSKLTRIISATQQIGEGNLISPIEINSRDEFSSLAKSLDDMRIQLKDAQDDRKRLLMGISHDLKTPLAGIKGYVQALRDGLADSEEKRDQYLAIINDKSDLLEHRIGALIEFVKLESSEWKIKTSELSILKVSDNWFAEFENDIEVSGHHCNLNNNLPSGLSCQLDVDLVRRALENLVSNAIKYSASDSIITLQASIHDAGYYFEVSNQGEPLPTGEQEQLFTAFYRGDRGRNTEGSGLGLTVVAKVAALHKGTSRYRYRDGKHVFSLEIPFPAI